MRLRKLPADGISRTRPMWGIWVPISESSRDFREWNPLSSGHWFRNEWHTLREATAVIRAVLSDQFTPEGVEEELAEILGEYRCSGTVKGVK